jgi:hypothetical protein
MQAHKSAVPSITPTALRFRNPERNLLSDARYF